MDDLRESLLKASRVARLEAIMDLVRSDVSGLERHNREWLAELLSPFSVESGEYHLTPAESPSQESALILRALRNDFLRNNSDRKFLTEFVTAVAKLNVTLKNEAKILTATDADTILRVASMLRNYLLEEQTLPSRPTSLGKRSALTA